MTDRELLELAAKAAGYVIVSYTDDGGAWVYQQGVPQNGDGEYPIFKWNPRDNDGDSMRLAVKLKLHVGINPGNMVFCLPTYSDKPRVNESCERDGVQDPYAATRRAIFRAAAEIGRKLSSNP